MTERRRSRGRPREVDPTGAEDACERFTVWVTPSMRAALAEIAAAEGVTLSELTRRAVVQSVLADRVAS